MAHVSEIVETFSNVAPFSSESSKPFLKFRPVFLKIDENFWIFCWNRLNLVEIRNFFFKIRANLFKIDSIFFKFHAIFVETDSTFFQSRRHFAPKIVETFP